MQQQQQRCAKQQHVLLVWVFCWNVVFFAALVVGELVPLFWQIVYLVVQYEEESTGGMYTESNRRDYRV